MTFLGKYIYHRSSYVLALVLLVMSTMPLGAQEPLQSKLYDENRTVQLLENLSYLEDPDSTVDVRAAITAYEAAQFTKAAGNGVDFGFTGYRYWLHYKVHNGEENAQTWIYDLGHVRMADFGVYILRNGKVETLVEIGGHDRFDARVIKHRLLLATFNIQANETIDIFVKFRSYGNTFVQPEFSQPSEFISSDSRAIMVHSLLFGALMLLVLYNLTMSVLLKSLPHLWYVIFVFVGLLHVVQQAGFAFVYLWPDYGALNSRIADHLGLLSIIFMLIFFRSFLSLKKKDKVMDIIAKFLIIATVILIGIVLVDRPVYIGKIGYSMMALVSLTSFIASVRAYRRGFKPARFAMLGWVGMLLAAIYMAMGLIGIIPMPISGDIIFELAMLYESLFFSASLLDYVTEIRVERNQAQKSLIQSLREGVKSSNRTAIEAEHRAMAQSEAASKSHALSAISHDIRQPIHALKLYIQGLRNTQDLSKSVKSLEQMSLTITSLEQLLSSVMDSSEPEASGDIIIKERFSVNRLMASTQLIFSTKAQEKGVQIRVVHSSLELFTDLGVMIRVLNNIVDNAVKYTERGKILIGCRRKGQRVVIQVIDTGRGIAEQQAKNIFDMYNRLDAQEENNTSYGLGLSIVKNLADKIGAKIDVRSKVGKGTVFELELPISPASYLENTSMPLQGVRAVIIDDNPITLEELDKQLADFGVQSLKGASWSECIKQMPSDGWLPDIFISDLHLANKVTGLEQATMVYGHYGKPIPTLIISFDRLAKTRRLVAAHDYAEMLYKPLDADILFGKLKEMLKL